MRFYGRGTTSRGFLQKKKRKKKKQNDFRKTKLSKLPYCTLFLIKNLLFFLLIKVTEIRKPRIEAGVKDMELINVMTRGTFHRWREGGFNNIPTDSAGKYAIVC